MATTIEQSTTSNITVDQKDSWRWYHLVPLVAIVVFVFTPTLTWQFGLPGSVRYIGDLTVVTMILLAIIRMLSIDRIPGAFLIILALSIVGIFVAAFEGQVFLATLWGWWTTFRYPLVGIYIYLVPDWPSSIPSKLPKIAVSILAIQVFFQLMQFAMGNPPGDFLSGTFGRKGTGLLILFNMQVIALAFGSWLSKGDSKFLLISLFLGGVSSILGEMKLFLIATPGMAVAALILHLLRRGQIRRSLIFLLFLIVAVVGYYTAYNRFFTQATGAPSLEAFLEGDKFDRYLNQVRQAEGNGSYHIGRGLAGEFAWNAIQRDTATILFGYGLGTNQISATFGLTGIGFDSNNYGVVLGSTSLMLLIQEMGVVGVAAFGLFIASTLFILYRATILQPDSDLDVIRFGVILFTLFWPLWIWYNSAWNMHGPALLYWIIWGYAMQKSVNPKGIIETNSPKSAGHLTGNI